MPQSVDLLVHVTHEAGVKVGGIGAVLDGLLSAKEYVQEVGRSIVVGPLNASNPGEMERLLDPRNGLRLRYASALGVNSLPAELSQSLRAVESAYNVRIVYGKRPFRGVEHEVLLLDLSALNPGAVGSFKYYLWDKFGLDCARYDYDPEFRLFVNLAEPAYAALFHLAAGVQGPRVILAHEWMGMPLVMAALIKDPQLWRTAFYAHEVATARLLVEEHRGHDTRFYNAMAVARSQGLSMDAVFGDQTYYYKHALIQRAAVCDAILAVGDLVVEELRFVGGAYAHKNIDLVYNGVPSFPITLAEKKQSKALLQAYAQNLLGYSPDFVFSHVTRFVTSKAMWRDIRVLDHLDHMLAGARLTATLFVLSSQEPTGRSANQIRAWEEVYGWPVGHRADNGDLLGQEVDYFFHSLEPFNLRSRAIKAVFVNQFGWSQDRCGRRMPAEMNFMDLRKGADVEFGQSIYEPFGIAQVEPLSFGAICVPSNVCGCVGFISRARAHLPEFPNVVVADYVTAPAGWHFLSPWDALKLDQYGRDLIEIENSRGVAEAIAARLPTDDAQSEQMIELGQEIGNRMSWEVVTHDYLLPALQRAIEAR
ncbi:MAG: hypothetical protein J5I90_09655 [Caldilineales bacterium]|nr:hypothetical protein [Caldilineales bacterium]